MAVDAYIGRTGVTGKTCVHCLVQPKGEVGIDTAGDVSLGTSELTNAL
jgi:hypothetical protein